eukprot:scaffold4315_cov25-Tisochrysis_lutea.AAC.2
MSIREYFHTHRYNRMLFASFVPRHTHHSRHTSWSWRSPTLSLAQIPNSPQSKAKHLHFFARVPPTVYRSTVVVVEEGQSAAFSRRCCSRRSGPGPSALRLLLMVNTLKYESRI